MNLDSIPYKDRFSGAGLLISKANRLSDSAEYEGADLTLKGKKAISKAVSFYRIALVVMKPFDPSYSTVMNWMCLGLIRLGRYSDAVKGYEEIIFISDSVDSKDARNATAKLAEEQIAKYRGMEDSSFVDAEDGDCEAFDDPPYCMFAGDFCDLLANGKIAKARQFFSDELKQQYSVKALREVWGSMVTDNELVDLELLQNSNDLETLEVSDIGWCYYSVIGEETDEAVSVVIGLTPANSFEVTKIEFGRP